MISNGFSFRTSTSCTPATSRSNLSQRSNVSRLVIHGIGSRYGDRQAADTGGLGSVRKSKVRGEVEGNIEPDPLGKSSAEFCRLGRNRPAQLLWAGSADGINAQNHSALAVEADVTARFRQAMVGLPKANDLADASQAGQFVLDMNRDIVAREERVIASVWRGQADDQPTEAPCVSL